MDAVERMNEVNPMLRSLSLRAGMALLMACGLTGTATAQDVAPSAAQASQATTEPLVAQPEDPAILKAFLASGLDSAKPELVIDYDAKGVPTRLALAPASGDDALDEAILAWGRQLRLSPGKAGRGHVPFDLSTKTDVPSSHYPLNVAVLDFRTQVVKAPSLEPITRAFGHTNLTRVAAELIIDYNASGDVVDARMVEHTMSASLDKDLVAWAKRIKLKAGQAGTARVPIRFDRR